MIFIMITFLLFKNTLQVDQSDQKWANLYWSFDRQTYLMYGSSIFVYYAQLIDSNGFGVI